MPMIDDIRRLLDRRPFQPFAVVTTGGNRYPVPTAEHAGLNPRGTRVVIWFDDGSGVTVPGRHICAVEEVTPEKLREGAG